jgi:hypothetical protein
VPYFVFASFAAFAIAADFKVILHGGISGAQRIARHLWRMCFALFFAAAFFFLGQQGSMPRFMHGSPLLFIPALAPLVLMFFWLFRVRFTNWFKSRSPVSQLHVATQEQAAQPIKGDPSLAIACQTGLGRTPGNRSCKPLYGKGRQREKLRTGRDSNWSVRGIWRLLRSV